MTVIYYMSIDRADKPWIGDRRLTEDSGQRHSQCQSHRFLGQLYRGHLLGGPRQDHAGGTCSYGAVPGRAWK